MAGRPRTTTKETTPKENDVELSSENISKIELLEEENKMLKSQVSEILNLLKDLNEKNRNHRSMLRMILKKRNTHLLISVH